MSREVIITLPDTVVINGAKKAPPEIRTVKTDKWDNDFIIAALTHAMSQKIGDPFSNIKNPAHVDNARRVHAAMEAGVWALREPGAAGAKLDAAIQALDITQLAAKLTPAQMVAIAEMCKKAI